MFKVVQYSLILVSAISFKPLAQDLDDYKLGSRQFELIAAREQIPGISQQWTGRGKMIWALEEYKDRIYIGFGDYGANTGPIPIVSYRPGYGFVQEATLNTEATENITNTNGHLYYSYTDHHHGLSPGTFAWQDQWSDTWRSANHFSDALHGYEVTSQNGRVYIATGGYTAQVRSTLDNGASWTTELAIDVNGEVSRFYHVGANSNTVFASGVSWDNGYRVLNYVKYGSSWYEIQNSNNTLQPISLNDELRMLYGSGFVKAEGNTVVQYSNLPHNTASWPGYNVSAPDNLLPFEVLFVIQDIGDGRKELFASTDFINWTNVLSISEQTQAGLIDIMKTVRRVAYHNNNLYLGTSDGHLYRLNDIFRYDPNQAPIANAGTNQTLIDQDRDGVTQVQLNGSASHDPDGAITNAYWSKNSLVIANGLTPTINLAVGSHTVILTVEDSEGAMAIDSTVINIIAGENNAPIAQTGADFTVIDEDRNGYEDVQLDASGSNDIDGSITRYAWLINETTILAEGEKVTVSLPVGVNKVSLWIEDNEDAKTRKDIYVTVVDGPNQAPVAVAGDDQTLIDEDRNGKVEVKLDGSSSYDNDGQLSVYTWYSSEGDVLATSASTTLSLNVGEHQLTLGVVDNEGATASDSLQIIIEDGINSPPIANAGLDQVIIDNDLNGSELVMLDGSGSLDLDGQIQRYIWRDENQDIIADGENVSVELALGTYQFELETIDSDQASHTDLVNISVVKGKDDTVDDDDFDGIVNADDNCPMVSNPAQLDDDKDAIGNACDNDLDNDGVVNSADNCPTKANPKQWNKDKDNLGNACDDDIDGDGFTNKGEKALGSDPKDKNSIPDLADNDNDGVINSLDNCPNKANSNQFDKDKDGLGNVCDDDIDGDGCSNQDEKTLGSLVRNPKSNACIETGLDDDLDGILNDIDNCPNHANAHQYDLDNDGVGNKCDDDIDGDGVTNQVENEQGTKPRDPNSF